MTLDTNLAIFGLMAMPLFLAISIVTTWLFFWMKMHRTAPRWLSALAVD